MKFVTSGSMVQTLRWGSLGFIALLYYYSLLLNIYQTSYIPVVVMRLDILPKL